MTPQPKTSVLQALATNVLSEGILAIEPATKDRVTGLLQQFASGALTVSDLRAALGGGAPAARPASPKSVAVIPLIGLLEPNLGFFSFLGIGTSVRAFIQQLTQATADSGINAIVVLTDSPGGLVSMIPEAAQAMRQARARKPVIAAVAGLAASAGYWIAANATKIRATPSARIGSIGVYTQRTSIVRALAESGIDVDTISAGRFKTEGLLETAMTDEERRAKQATIDGTYAEFVNDVALGRTVPASRVLSGFGEGRVVSAKQAVIEGMIDDVQLVDTTIARAAGSDANDRATAIAEQLALERALFELDMPGSDELQPRLQGKAALDADRLRLEIALLSL